MKVKIVILLFLSAICLTSLVIGVSAAEKHYVISVNSTADIMVPSDGQCTLREAISNSNMDDDFTGGDCRSGNGNDVIVIPAGTYNLEIPGSDEDNNYSGDLDILESLTISGSDMENTVILGNELDRVIHVIGKRTRVEINHLTITGGVSNQGVIQGGGGILNEFASLEIQDATIRGNVLQAGSR